MYINYKLISAYIWVSGVFGGGSGWVGKNQ
ncbi:Protein CBG26511 [Caenorhabditis briggsae]|uniref:Protein CBG26511 n=1 Tax=Caenorhabditis briggsae TaxID=6238 RepID=B6IG34_CAEBR|nr:Protein CBG26511 [Caenorhabditis briggsae]CAR98864.1 Protein CBG26511 [Caenorhabditis briggsae]